MLKRKAIRKIALTTFIVLVLLTIYLIPSKKENTYNNVTYYYQDTTDVFLYLLNQNNQLTMVNYKIPDSDIEKKVKTIVEKLIISQDATIPDGLMQIIPKDVNIVDIKVDEQVVYIKFSKEFLDIDKDKIEDIIESITYSVLSIKELSGVSIYVGDDNISKLFPKNIPNIITKEYGINKRYELKNFIDISKIVIYYLDDINDSYYYVPVTKYKNDEREKIKIIIDELSSNYIFESNLITLLDKNIKLLDYEINSDKMYLNFNNSIFLDQDKILEEVVYSISYSVFANYDVEEVIFLVNDKEILKKTIKDIE